MPRFSSLLAATALALVLSMAGPAQGSDNDNPAEKLDLRKPGVFHAGQWEYRFIITGEGTKSRGSIGDLLFAGKPVEDPGVRWAYYNTPWGPIGWVGDNALPWGEHGWMPMTHGTANATLLPDPWLQGGGPVVMMMVLSHGQAADGAQKIDPWIQAETDKLGLKDLRIERPWSYFNDQAVTIHDTKMYGRLLARLAPPRNAETFVIQIDGRKPDVIELPRKDGATKLATFTLHGLGQDAVFCLAFRVDRAAANWPTPLDVGPECNGKTVAVTGKREIVIALPGSQVSGCVWTITSVQGESIKGGAVRAVGQPQFVPGDKTAASRGEGTFENTLRVIEKGKADVELQYKRLWQTDAPPEKTFKVTFDVQDLPATPAGKP